MGDRERAREKEREKASEIEIMYTSRYAHGTAYGKEDGSRHRAIGAIRIGQAY